MNLCEPMKLLLKVTFSKLVHDERCYYIGMEFSLTFAFAYFLLLRSFLIFS